MTLMFKNRTQVPLSPLSEILDPPPPNDPTLENSSISGHGASALRGVADLMGEIAATLERAREFPGRLADARKLRRRLVLRAACVEQRVADCQRQMSEAREHGREFVERKLRAEIRALEEERLDTSALLGEVERVFQRLRRERRTLLYRLECGLALVESGSTRSRRESIRQLFDEALRHLESAAVEAGTGIDA